MVSLQFPSKYISSRFLQNVIVIVGAIGPALLVLTLIFQLGASPSEFHPYYSDEVHYWNEESTLAAVGFRGGYSVINELPAKVEKSIFGPHGPALIMAMYPYASVAGWSPQSPLVFNALFVSISIFVFLVFAAKSTREKALASLFLATAFPIILFIPTAMQESWHQGVAVTLSAYVVYVIRSKSEFNADRQFSGLHSGTLLGVMCLVSFVRPSWALIYALCMVPVLEASRSRLIKMALSSTAIIASFGFMYFLFSPTQSSGQLAKLQLALVGDLTQLASFVNAIADNAFRYFYWNTGEEFPATLLRYELLVVLATSTYLLIRRKECALTATERSLVVISWLILIFSILSVFVLYEVGSWRDYRTLAPSFVLACLILMAVKKATKLIIFVILVQAISLPMCVDTFNLYRRNNFSQWSEVSAYKASLRGVVAYVPSQSGWCNTLLVLDSSQDAAFLVALALEPGIGMSVVHRVDTLKGPIKSRYVLVNSESTQQLKSAGLFNESMQPIILLNNIGLVYKNNYEKCG